MCSFRRKCGSILLCMVLCLCKQRPSLLTQAPRWALWYLLWCLGLSARLCQPARSHNLHAATQNLVTGYAALLMRHHSLLQLRRWCTRSSPRGRGESSIIHRLADIPPRQPICSSCIKGATVDWQRIHHHHQSTVILQRPSQFAVSLPHRAVPDAVACSVDQVGQVPWLLYSLTPSACGGFPPHCIIFYLPHDPVYLQTIVFLGMHTPKTLAHAA